MGKHNGAVCCCCIVLAPKIFLELFRCSSLYSRNTPNFNFDPGNSGRIASSRKCQSCQTFYLFLFILWIFGEKNRLTTSCLWLSRILATMNENVAPKKGEEKRSLKSGPVYNLITTINPLTPRSDKHLNSPHNITSDSHIQVTGIKEMIITYRSSWFWNKVSLSVP